MADLQKYSAKICYTVAAFLIVKRKILLVKHKKLNIWLAPGGHVEPNELMHVAAQRECAEETRVTVVAYDTLSPVADTQFDSVRTENLQSPILTNLHWVSRENYDARIKDPANYQPQAPWLKGCEQHLNFIYLVRPVSSIAISQNIVETDGIGWFSLKDMKNLETTDDIRFEVNHAFRLLGLR